MMAGAGDDPQIGGAVGIGDRPSVEDRHDLVVGAVDEHQLAGASRAGGVDGRGRRDLGDHSSNERREVLVADDRPSRGRARGASADCGPSRRSRRATPIAATPVDVGSSAARRRWPSAPPVPKPTIQTPSQGTDSEDDRRRPARSRRQPPREKSPSDSPTPRLEKASAAHPASVGDPVGELGEAGRGGDAAAGLRREAVGDHQPRLRGRVGPARAAPDARRARCRRP